MRWFLRTANWAVPVTGVSVTSMTSGASSLPFDESEKRSTASVIEVTE